MGTSIALADCNNFYAACEQVFRPDWANRPIVVMGNNDGNIIARSAAAKALGIPMGIPLYQVKHLIHAHDVIVVSANFSLYGDLSGRVMDVLSHFTSRLEPYSIDEAFLDLSAIPAPLRHEYAVEIRSTVGRWTGIPISVGIGPTKTLAKIASDKAKKRPEGVISITCKEERDRLLTSLDVEEVWGIGHRRAAVLRSRGIATAYDLMQADAGWIKQHLFLAVAKTQLELRGVPWLELSEVRGNKKQICTSRSFGRPVTCLVELKEVVALFSSRGAHRARMQHTQASVLVVFITTNPFQSSGPQYNTSVTVKLPRPTHDTLEIVEAAHAAVGRIYKEGYAYHKAGVILTGFVDDRLQQGRLFSPAPDPRRDDLMRVLDEVNARFGQDALRLLGTGLDRPWRMKQCARSPHYTTRWHELPLVR